MRILLSALACNPLTGSESAVGWSVASALAKRHEVWVLLHEQSRRCFEEFGQALPEGLHLHFLGDDKPHHPNRLLARIESWRENYFWHRNLLQPAKILHEKIQFDLVHHVTYATWRVASPLWQLGIPFIWGPLGGGELFPWQARGILSTTAFLFEIARSTSNFLSLKSTAVRQCARNSAVCVAGNRETSTLLRKLRGELGGVESLCVSFFSEELIAEFRNLLPQKSCSGPLRCFAGGNLEGRKGTAIALKALADLKDQSFTYHLGGGGPEQGHLRLLAQSLGIEEKVLFGESLRGDAYRQELLNSHVYLQPSLRDNSGRTLMEAMLAGCVPIVADCGGPGEIVTDACGFRVPVAHPKEMARAIAHILSGLDAPMLERMGRAAHERIATYYSETSYLRSIEAIYEEAISRHIHRR